MDVLRSETLPVRTDADIVRVRQLVREWSQVAKFSLVDQTKMVTAASEIARNTLDHGGGGMAMVELVQNGIRMGVRVTFQDTGKGIPDIDLAMRDGYTTGGGLGLGLGGAKRLVNEFAIGSKAGEGTKVVITRWK